MKLLFINQFFWPDSSATSQQLTDLTVRLVASGHDVTVLCGEGGYASSASAVPPLGVNVLRVRSLPYVRGKVGRILSYCSFYLTALVRGITLKRRDIVVTLTTPPLISLLGWLIRGLRGSRHVIYEQDMYPDVAVDLNKFKAGGLADRVVGTLADFARRRADVIIALGSCMKSRLEMRGIPGSRIVVAENWADGSAILPLPRPGNPEELVLLYSGNLGLAHDLDTLTGAIKQLSQDRIISSRFRFLFVGSGGRRNELAQFCEANEIHSVELRPYVSRDRLSEGLALGDIGIVTQHKVCCGSVVPSKVYGILAAGRPVLFIGPRAATPSLIIQRHDCGWQIEPGDVSGLVNLLIHLVGHPDLARDAGNRARQALIAHYDLPGSVERIEKILVESLRAPGQVPCSPSQSALPRASTTEASRSAAQSRTLATPQTLSEVLASRRRR